MNDLPISSALVAVTGSGKTIIRTINQKQVWRHRLSRLFSEYGWALLPIVVIVIFLANTHYNYAATWLGNDEPYHFNNILSIVHTGQMPPPPNANQTCDQTQSCEAFQPPLFYELMAIPIQLTENTVNASAAEANTVKVVIFLMSILWFMLVLYVIQLIMPRRARLAKMLIACAAMLIAQVVMIDTMVTNDFPETIASFATLIVLYLIIRTDRKSKLIWWLLAAGLAGLCVAFKYSGIQFAVVYAAVAGVIAFGYLIQRHPVRMGKILLYAAAGSPLIVVPYLSTVQHELLYLGSDSFQTVPFDDAWKGDFGTFFGTFDTSIFSQPMWGLVPNASRDQQAPGISSFWSLQYIGLFVDSDDRWFSSTEFGLTPDQLKVNLTDGSTLFLGHPLSIVRYNRIVLVTRLAIPIGLLIASGLIYGSVQLIRHPRRAMRSGTIVVLAAAAATFGSFIEEIIHYHNRAWFTQPRYALATYILLLIIGAAWVTKLWPKHRGLVKPMLQWVLWASVAAFCIASYQLFWLTIG